MQDEGGGQIRPRPPQLSGSPRARQAPSAQLPKPPSGSRQTLLMPSSEVETGALQLTTQVSPTQAVPGPQGPGCNGPLAPPVAPQPVTPAAVPPELPPEPLPEVEAVDVVAPSVVAASCTTERQQAEKARRVSGRARRTRGLCEQAWCQVKGLKLHSQAAISEAPLDGPRHSDVQSAAQSSRCVEAPALPPVTRIAESLIHEADGRARNSGGNAARQRLLLAPQYV